MVNLKIILLVGACVIFGTFLPLELWAEDAASSEDLYYHCQDDVLGVKFSCRKEWQQQAQDNAFLIIIQEDPAITMTVTRSKDKALFLEQLNEERLKELGQYGVGFTKEMAEVAGTKAVQVDGYSDGGPDIRVRDYYIIHDDWLYIILFSVAPREAWFSAKPLIEKIMKSFVLI